MASGRDRIIGAAGSKRERYVCKENAKLAYAESTNPLSVKRIAKGYPKYNALRLHYSFSVVK